ncbi:MAG: hypothetical protein Q4A56_09180 [Porphyromonadaceae bacterium]|nr:hypothetical protein [Porphyromonadaceae bacterium]
MLSYKEHKEHTCPVEMLFVAFLPAIYYSRISSKLSYKTLVSLFSGGYF